MEIKKNKKENLEKRKKYFFQIGLVMSLSFVLVAFEYVEYDGLESGCKLPITISLEEDEIIPITIQAPPPPPPPKPPTAPIFEIVTEIIEIEDEIEFETDADDGLDLELMQMDEEVEIIVEDKVPYYQNPQVLPSYKGGLGEMYKFLARNLRYPRLALQNEISGEVFCKFNVMEDGSISEIIIIHGIGFGCDEEAKRVIGLFPNWNPALQGNRKVRTSLTIPISFKLK